MGLIHVEVLWLVVWPVGEGEGLELGMCFDVYDTQKIDCT